MIDLRISTPPVGNSRGTRYVSLLSVDESVISAPLVYVMVVSLRV